jgi:hypothetical protein
MVDRGYTLDGISEMKPKEKILYDLTKQAKDIVQMHDKHFAENTRVIDDLQKNVSLLLI